MTKKAENSNETQNPKLGISVVSKRSQLKSELTSLHIELNSSYNAYGHIEPSLERQKIIMDRIDAINEKLKNVC